MSKQKENNNNDKSRKSGNKSNSINEFATSKEHLLSLRNEGKGMNHEQEEVLTTSQPIHRSPEQAQQLGALLQTPATKASIPAKAPSSTNTIQRSAEEDLQQQKEEEVIQQKTDEQQISTASEEGESDPTSDDENNKTPIIQKKTTIGAADSPEEREADAMADKVVQRMASNEQEEEVQDQMHGSLQVQRSAEEDQFFTVDEPAVQKKTAIGAANGPEEQEADMMADKVIQRKSTYKTTASDSKPSSDSSDQGEQATEQKDGTVGKEVENKLHSRSGAKGEPLPDQVKGDMESGFNADFDKVRIHNDAEAQDMSRSLGAQAFTHGSDIYFGQGKYQPNSTEGKRLLGHELTHTIQQGAVRRKKIQRSPVKYQVQQKKKEKRLIFYVDNSVKTDSDVKFLFKKTVETDFGGDFKQFDKIIVYSMVGKQEAARTTYTPSGGNAILINQGHIVMDPALYRTFKGEKETTQEEAPKATGDIVLYSYKNPSKVGGLDLKFEVIGVDGVALYEKEHGKISKATLGSFKLTHAEGNKIAASLSGKLGTSSSEIVDFKGLSVKLEGNLLDSSISQKGVDLSAASVSMSISGQLTAEQWPGVYANPEVQKLVQAGVNIQLKGSLTKKLGELLSKKDLDNLKKQQKALEEAQEERKKAEQLKKEAKQQQDQLDAKRKERADQSKARAQQKKDLKKLQSERNQLKKQLEKGEIDEKTFRKQSDKLSKEIKESKKLGQQLDNHINKLKRQVDDIVQRVKQLEDAARKVLAKVERIKAQVEKLAANLTSKLAKLIGKRALAFMAKLIPIIGVIIEIIELAILIYELIQYWGQEPGKGDGDGEGSDPEATGTSADEESVHANEQSDSTGQVATEGDSIAENAQQQLEDAKKIAATTEATNDNKETTTGNTQEDETTTSHGQGQEGSKEGANLPKGVKPEQQTLFDAINAGRGKGSDEEWDDTSIQNYLNITNDIKKDTFDKLLKSRKFWITAPSIAELLVALKKAIADPDALGQMPVAVPEGTVPAEPGEEVQEYNDEFYREATQEVTDKAGTPMKGIAKQATIIEGWNNAGSQVTLQVTVTEYDSTQYDRGFSKKIDRTTFYFTIKATVLPYDTQRKLFRFDIGARTKVKMVAADGTYNRSIIVAPILHLKMSELTNYDHYKK